MFLQIAFGFSGDLGAVFPELTKIVGRYMVDVQACADGYSMSAMPASMVELGWV